uniref:Translation initiation factor IF-2-like isoform X2 n=1 Tax=Geotrypetes seraphini TaxID=260995 RepID=A0A6P8Q5L5_GEOSA|nr:translation initiation factor IF-2-like isoform X2 [Geotrypetes seraphini]
MAARAASAGSDVAEISFRVGDSLLDDSDEQVGAGGAAVRARPSRRSKRDALSAIAIAASVGRGAGRSSEPGVSSDGVVPRKATGKSKHGGRGKSGGRQPVRPESSSSGASGLLPGVGSVAPVIQPASGDLTEPVVLPLPISGGDGDAGQVFPPFGDGSARSEERVFRESPQPSTSWGAGSWGTSPGEPYGAPYGAFPWGPGQQGWCTGQQGWSPGMFSPYFGGGFVPGWSGGPLPSGVGGAGWGAPGGGFPGSVPGCGFSSQSPLVVPETRWSATGGVTGPSSGSVGAAFDRRRSEGAPATSALVTVAVGGGAAGPSEDVVVADRGGTVVERPSVSSAEVVSSGISVPVTESSIAGAGRCKLVWIIGHSFVHWAGERSRLRPGGRHLGLGHLGVRVSWWGQRGMRWYQLLPFLAHLRDSPRRPDVLIIHLGGNDVDSLSARQLVNVIKDDLRVLFAWFPGTRVLWSDVIPRPRCLSSRRWTRGLAKFNRQVGKWVESQGGTQLLHGWVDVGCGGLYHADRVHLSDIGCDLLLDDFAVGCERVLGLC